MTEFNDLQAMAGSMYSNDESRKWLFSHTRDENEYQQIRRALKILAGYHPVEWQGKTGERRPVECDSIGHINDRCHLRYDELMAISVQGGDE